MGGAVQILHYYVGTALSYSQENALPGHDFQPGLLKATWKREITVYLGPSI